MSFFIYAIIFIGVTSLVQTLLILRQMHYVSCSTIPPKFQGLISNQEFQHAMAYNLAKLRVSMVKNWLINGVTLLLINSFFLNDLLGIWYQTPGDLLLQEVGFLLSVLVLVQLMHLPISYWQIFVLEQRFGFNNMTLTTWIFDFFRQILLIACLSAPLIFIACWFLNNDPLWWFWIWVLGTVAATLYLLFSPLIISIFYYTHNPLNHSELIAKSQTLLSGYGFSQDRVFVIDSSKRTQHANAHFVGFGEFRRILLSDTLMDHFSCNEITAIIAHELGHYYHRHIFKYLIFNSILSLIGLLFFNWIFIHFLNNVHEFPQIGIAKLILLGPLIYFWLKPLFGAVTRYFEFQADQFTVINHFNRPLHDALIRLYARNKSLLSHDTWYGAWHNSHPSPEVRIEHLDRPEQ